jgi:hypothetical protein
MKGMTFIMKKKSWLGQNRLKSSPVLVLGIVAIILSELGNPANMGFCYSML